MNDEILKLKQTMLEEMVDYMNYTDDDGDEDDSVFDSYSQADVDRCSEIVDIFLTTLEKAPNANRNEFIMEAVKVAILDLNELNEQCNHELIETEQREQLCEIIELAAKKAGLLTDNDDITGEWRDW